MKLGTTLLGLVQRRFNPHLAEADSIADPRLRQDVWGLLLGGDLLKARIDGDGVDPCRDRRLARVEILEVPTPTPDTPPGFVGPWSERWIVDRCGMEIGYTIDFTVAADGGTDFHIQGGAES